MNVRMLKIQILLAGLLLSACDQAVGGDAWTPWRAPATRGPTREIESRLLGGWSHKGTQETTTLVIRRRDDRNYTMESHTSTPGGRSWSYTFDMFHSDVGTLRLLTAKQVRPAKVGPPSYFCWGYGVSANRQTLTLWLVDSKLVPPSTATTSLVQQLLNKHARNSRLYGYKTVFTRSRIPTPAHPVQPTKPKPGPGPKPKPTPSVTPSPLLLPPANIPRDPKEDPTSKHTYYVIPIRGTIGQHFTARDMWLHLYRMKFLSPEVVLLDIDTSGGSTTHTKDIVNMLLSVKGVRRVAFVRRAISAGVPIALVCTDIYASDTATIGGAVSFVPGKDGLPVNLPKDVAEKLQSIWRATCRMAAEHGGHSKLLSEAMIDPDFALTMRTVDGKKVLERDGKGKVLKRKGQILTLTAREAVDAGLANGLVDDYATLGEQLKMKGWRRVWTLLPGEKDFASALSLDQFLDRKAAELRGPWPRPQGLSPAQIATMQAVLRRLAIGRMVRWKNLRLEKLPTQIGTKATFELSTGALGMRPGSVICHLPTKQYADLKTLILPSAITVEGRISEIEFKTRATRDLLRFGDPWQARSFVLSYCRLVLTPPFQLRREELAGPAALQAWLAAKGKQFGCVNGQPHPQFTERLRNDLHRCFMAAAQICRNVRWTLLVDRRPPKPKKGLRFQMLGRPPSGPKTDVVCTFFGLDHYARLEKVEFPALVTVQGILFEPQFKRPDAANAADRGNVWEVRSFELFMAQVEKVQEWKRPKGP